ncbi:MAG: DEAD/DEAH box helicase [Deltaproteobacteria bacterium]|nr:DEAD/DEAH box helicase [Deltaproteobacteria bacterium]
MTDDRAGEWGFERPRPTPWAGAHGVDAVLRDWRNTPKVKGNLVLDLALSATPAVLDPIPEGVSAALVGALARRGIERLFSHQARAYRAAVAGRDLVIATPTASGKSLCYHLPVLQALAEDPNARALYLFPTKALSRDQEVSLRALLADAGLDQGAITYDGDTPGDARRAAREKCAVLLTNPDMLHTGILPHHTAWARLFANLRYVVIDELHTYRGVLGSHLANLLRRLSRVAAFHGSAPVFLMASATVGNPREHAARLIGREALLICESGAPQGERQVLVYNPPIVNRELGIRASYVKSAVRLVTDLIRAKVPTLVFAQSRSTVEVMLKYLRDAAATDSIDPALIQGYRGGYLPGTRRDIENGLRAGAIRCVVATNALELGIDIGMLDAVVCAGYPGSMAALWQRFGRGGRRGERSLALLVASSAPLDQYFATLPATLVGAAIEQARIDPDNVEILVQHLKCAAFELPFAEGDGFRDLSPDDVSAALQYLTEHELLHRAATTTGKALYHWSSESYPANHVSLRSVGWDNIVIIDVERDLAIAELDWKSSHTMLHEQAIYQQDGEQYQVEKLDLDNHKAYVRKVEPDYYTTAMTYTKVAVIKEDNRAPLPWCAEALRAGAGDVSVVEKVVGYKKIKFHSHENVGYGDVRLPEIQMHTTAFWLTVAESAVAAQAAPRPAVIDAIRGIGHALHTVATVGLMTDGRDLGWTLGEGEGDGVPAHKDAGGAGFNPTLFLYDHVPGGVGLAERLFVEKDVLLVRARTIIESCACDGGCPACVGPTVGVVVDGGETTSGSRKEIALALLGALGVPRTA